MKKPNLFIVGAPKCGTTSLASWLSEHPNIYMSPIKEPHYFSEDCYRVIDNYKSYMKLFSGAGKEHVIVGEASTWYLYSKVAVKKIVQIIPDAKFVVCVRNPITMAPSLHEQSCYGLHEDVCDFKKAWELINERKMGNKLPKRCRDPKKVFYDEVCMLGTQVENLIELVGKERIHIVLLDDMKNDSRAVYRNVLSFLGVEDDGRICFEKHNEAKVLRSVMLKKIVQSIGEYKQKIGITYSFGMDKFVSKKRKREELSEEMKKKLVDFYGHEINKLEVLLDRDLKKWMN